MDTVTAALSHAVSLIAPGTRLGVAVSGGADSVCLLHALGALYEQVTVLHVNHHLRSSESDADEQFVRELAASLNLPLRVLQAEPPADGNLEEAAREIRRAWFLELIAGGAVQRVALAHTRNDQAETVLFRLLRGAYTTGLAGMRAVSPGGLIRPLLDLPRAEIEAWLRARGLTWREDSSNRDLRFARNRIRHTLLPVLEADWNPALTSILANHARLAQEDEDYWSAQLPPPSSILDLRELLVRPPALRRRILRDTIRHVRRDLKQIDFRHIEQVLELAKAPDGHGRLQIPGVDVMRSFDWMRFATPHPGPQERDWEVEVNPPQVVPLPAAEWEVITELRDTLDDGIESVNWARVQSEAGGPLVLRNWRPGDRYRRQGRTHEQKVKEMFHEARVPLWERRDWPILSAGSHIVWARRFGPAAEFVLAGPGRALVVSERKRIAGGN